MHREFEIKKNKKNMYYRNLHIAHECCTVKLNSRKESMHTDNIEIFFKHHKDQTYRETQLIVKRERKMINCQDCHSIAPTSIEIETVRISRRPVISRTTLTLSCVLRSACVECRSGAIDRVQCTSSSDDSEWHWSSNTVD